MTDNEELVVLREALALEFMNELVEVMCLETGAEFHRYFRRPFHTLFNFNQVMHTACVPASYSDTNLLFLMLCYTILRDVITGIVSPEALYACDTGILG